MKTKYFLVCGIMFCVSMVGYCCTYGVSCVQRLSVDRREIDFGEVFAGTNVTRHVILTNTGSRSLNIREIRMSCGCTQARTSRQQLEPGEASTLEIWFAPGLIRSAGSTDLLVFCNDSMEPACKIVAKYSIVGGAISEPPEVDFGRVDRTELPRRFRCRIIIEPSVVANAQELRCLADEPFITARLLEPNQDGTNQAEVVLTKDTPSGDLSARVRLEQPMESCSMCIPIYACVRGRFYAEPSAVFMGDLKHDDGPVSEMVIIRERRSNCGVRIESISLSESLKGLVTAETSVGDAETKIRLLFAPSKCQGTWSTRRVDGYIRVHVAADMQVGEWLNVPISIGLRAPRSQDAMLSRVGVAEDK